MGLVRLISDEPTIVLRLGLVSSDSLKMKERFRRKLLKVA
jgi:hypothetical protein